MAHVTGPGSLLRSLALRPPSRPGPRPSAPPWHTCSANQQLNCSRSQRQDSNQPEQVGNLSSAPPRRRTQSSHPPKPACAPSPQPRPRAGRPSFSEARIHSLVLPGPLRPVPGPRSGWEGTRRGGGAARLTQFKASLSRASDAASAAS